MANLRAPFFLPLAAYKYLGWPLAATLHRRDGYRARRPLPVSFRRRTMERSASFARHSSFLVRDPQAWCAEHPPDCSRSRKSRRRYWSEILEASGERCACWSRENAIRAGATYHGAADHYSARGTAAQAGIRRPGHAIAAPGLGARHRRQHRPVLAHCCRVPALAWSHGTRMWPHRIATGGRPGKAACPYFRWSLTWPGRLRRSDGATPNPSPCWSERASASIAS